MRKDAVSWIAGAAVALAALLASAAPAAADGPTTVSAYAQLGYDPFRMVLTGRLPDSSTCQYSSSYGFQWGASAGALTRSETAYECSGRDYTASIAGDYLWGGTTYYYRAALNGSSSYVGETKSFVTPALAPTVEEGWATEIERTSFTARGAIADEGALTTFRVRWGVAGGPLDQLTPVQQMPGDGGPPQDVVAPISGLTPGTHYTFRFEAENAKGRTVGPETTVGAGATAPEIVITALRRTDDELHVRALVDANGMPTEDVDLTPWDYPWPAYYPWTWDQTGNAFTPIVREVRYTGLAPDTEYRVGWRARNDLGDVRTDPLVLRTMPPGQVWEAPADPVPAPQPPPGDPGAPSGDAPKPGGGGSGGGGGAPLVPVSPGGTIVDGRPQPLSVTSPSRAGTTSSGLASTSIRTLLARGLDVRGVRAGGAGRVELTLRAKVTGRARPVLARAAHRFTRAGGATLRLRPTKAGRAWLRGRRGATVELVTTFRPARGGKATTQTRKVTLVG